MRNGSDHLKMISKLLFVITLNAIHQLGACLSDTPITPSIQLNQNAGTGATPIIKPDQSDDSCRNVFVAISLTTLFVYLLSLSMADFVLREKIPEVYGNKRPDKPCLILSKYLIKIVFGKWSSNLEFQNTLLTIEFNGQDSKSSMSSFSIPTDWLKKLMDHIGTKENPLLKSIKFWVYQPDSLGMITSVKIGLKDLKKTASFIYIDSIEASKVSDDKIQVINIQKNVCFTSEQPLTIELAFRQNTKVTPVEGYSPHFSFSDHFYFYIIYLDFSYFLLNLKSNWLFFSVEPGIMNLVLDTLVAATLCTAFIVLMAVIYLFSIKSKLATRHNSVTMQAFNSLFLASLFIGVFATNYLHCEATSYLNKQKTTPNPGRKEYSFFIRLLFVQAWFLITFIILWTLSMIVKCRAMKQMVAKATDLDPSMSNEDKLTVSRMSTGVSKPPSGDNLRSSVISKSMPEMSAKVTKRPALPIYAKRSTTPSATPSTTMSATPSFKKIYPSTLAPKEESKVNRHDSDNSIGSGYYHQMITATKHVRSISQYGELLKENKY